jgi:RNA polymerase sigma factor (TIGR02999 family)
MSEKEFEHRPAGAVGSSHHPMRRLSDCFGSVYPQLRAMAATMMRRERASHTLQPTAVVSEAFLRLASRETEEPFASESHLLAYAATTMRSVLVDHARRRMSKKRGRAVTSDAGLFELLSATTGPGVDLLEIDDALKALEAADARAARVVEARVFGGLTIEEVAEAMDLSLSSVSRDWRFGRAFLAGQLSVDGAVPTDAEDAA